MRGGMTRVAADKRYPQRLRALLNPLMTLPAAQASPPTIGTPVNVGAATLVQTTGSALASPIIHPYYITGVFANGVNTARFRRTGWTLTNRFNNGFAMSPGGYTGGSYPAAVEFMHYGGAFEVRVNGESGSIVLNIIVDGAPGALTAYQIAAGSAAFVIPVTFSTTALRRIRIEFTRSCAFGGIIIAGNDYLAATGRGLGPQIYLCGDSYSDGANGVAGLDTYAVKLGRLLQADMWIDGQGGTGFVGNGGGGAKSEYLPRITAAGTEPRLVPDLVIIQGSTNDGNSSQNAAAVTAASAACIAQVRSQWPNAKLIIPGLMLPLRPSSLPSTNTNNNSNLRTSATATGFAADLFIDVVTEAWFTGNGNLAAPANNGNADVFMSSDGVHGTPAWHEMIAAMLARRITEYVMTI